MTTEVSTDEDHDLMQNAFYAFVEAMQFLAAPVETQSASMPGEYVPFDVKNDAIAGLFIRHSVANGLTASQRERMAELETGLSSLPIVAFDGRPFTRESCRTAMEHPAWEPLRKQAWDLLKSLASAIQKNREYLRLD